MYLNDNIHPFEFCEPVVAYSRSCRPQQPSLFNDCVKYESSDIRVVELFAGVGGFRIGLERASSRFKTIWSNQWEPSTKRQDASIVYCRRFGFYGHCNEDINTIPTSRIPEADLLVGGFPCQDYSVANTLSRSGGIEGKKGVLWWQIYRILHEHTSPPRYLMLENVDRLLSSPASQRGRDFAIILASLADLGYVVEWRVLNAAEYGMPQRRKRTYIFAYKTDTPLAASIRDKDEWLTKHGILASAFPVADNTDSHSVFTINGTLEEISEHFNKGRNSTPFMNAGLMTGREVRTAKLTPAYSGMNITLGDILIDENLVDEEFFVKSEDVEKWAYAKGRKSMKRINKKTGFEYNYSEGAMAFPDYTDRPSRTIITGEGGAAPSRFKHIIKTPSGRYRRLTPLELERLNMFPDNHTEGSSALRRAFLMGNALVTGIVERIANQFIARGL